MGSAPGPFPCPPGAGEAGGEGSALAGDDGVAGPLAVAAGDGLDGGADDAGVGVGVGTIVGGTVGGGVGVKTVNVYVPDSTFLSSSETAVQPTV
jgi:hypothetical protein